MTKISSDGATPCPYCGGASDLHLRAGDINRRASAAVFDLFRCVKCGLLRIVNPPADLAPYYNDDYHPVPADRDGLEPYLAAHRFKINLLTKIRPGGDLLEIGPSIGSFCALAQTAGFKVSAIEMDQDCARFLDDKLDVNVTNSNDPLAVLTAQEATYDVICMWHSIEHLAEPWRVLEQACARLRPGGILLIAAPNPLSRQARMMGAAWPHHDLPRHLFGLPMPWLENWSREHGLTKILATTRDEGSIHFNRFSYAIKLHHLAPFARFKPLFWVLGLKLGVLMSPWEDKEGEGACYVMVMEKPPTAEKSGA